MSICREHVAAIESFGYSPSEAAFLYLVATHSGYFTRNQFLRYTGFQKGCLVHRLTTRAIALKHATVKEYGQTHIYHLFSRQIYGAIHKDNLRNRRELSKELIRARLLILDFVLTYPEYQYLETEPDKVRYFHGELGIPLAILPSRTYKSLASNSQTVRYFVDRFPIFLDANSAMTPTFVYCDSDLPGLFSFATYLRNYQALFRRLPACKLIYAAPGSLKIAPAQRLFQRMFAANESIEAVKLLRYFRIRQLWENHQTGLLTRADRDLLREGDKKFHTARFDGLYHQWTNRIITESEIANQIRTTSNTQSSCFETRLLPESYGIFHQINCAPIRPPAEIQRSSPRSSSDVTGSEAKFMKAQGL